MTLRTLGVLGLGVILTCVRAPAQAPPAAGDATAPGFDISGYWTAAMHEDAMERGAGEI